MTRRSTPQKKIDDNAFPVRLFISVPPMGLGRRYADMHNWLDTEVGRGQYAHHSAGSCPIAGGMSYRMALYFRHPSHAAAFATNFTDLELADGTILPTYTSPYRR